MITLITAVPGSGKTLLSISIIIEALNSNRPVYTNISGLVKDKFPNNHLLYDAPNDWRDCPNGSLVIYDECQQPHLYPSNAQRGKVEDERLTAMETHRHGGYDLIFITQAPTFVHHHVRKLVGRHIHLYRARGVSGASKYEWSHTCESPNDRKEQQRADHVLWKFDKSHYPYYTSAVMHTHKFKMPFKLAVLLVFIAIGIAAVAYMFIKNEGLASVASSKQLTESAQAVTQSASAVVESPPNPYMWSKVEPAVPVAGCIASASRAKCMCFSADGVTLQLEHAACLSIINSPLPRQFLAPKTSKKEV